jgi:squalene-hopene/tetraprenyl-beta-curcumene cyclase
MNTTDLVQMRCVEAPTLPTARRPALAPSRHELAAPVRHSIFRARQFLVGRQRLDGSWAGRRSGDVVSLSQLVLLHAYLGRERSELVEQAARAIRRDQRAEGGWALAPGRPIDRSASVLAYFALKIAGEDPSHPTMRSAREAIRASGGADAVNAATRFWLALLGQIDYDCCPPIPPEQLLTPASRKNLTPAEKQQWAAQSVVSSLRPVRELELASGVRELFILPPQAWPTMVEHKSRNRSAALSKFWSWCDRVGWLPFRRTALDRATSWLVDGADGGGDGEPSIGELVWRRIALTALGFAPISPPLAACERRLQRLVVVDAELDEARSQRETLLTADTAVVIEALYASGLGVVHPAVAAGIGWLVEHRLPTARGHRNTGELASMLRSFACLAAGSESASAILPPDLNISAGRHARYASVPSSVRHQLLEELRLQVLAAQRSDGSWSACSADHGTTAESSPAATGAILNVLSSPGPMGPTAVVRRAAGYLRLSQRGDGSWDSADGAGYLYGTTWAIRGLIAAGASPDDPVVAAGVNWLLVHQLESGGWGEADASAVQTAWAVLALVAAGQADHDATRRAIDFLAGAQQGDGTWSDRQPTEHDPATGGWYRNDLHATALPTMALANWAVSVAAQPRDRLVALRLISDESASEGS